MTASVSIQNTSVTSAATTANTITSGPILTASDSVQEASSTKSLAAPLPIRRRTTHLHHRCLGEFEARPNLGALE
jgi:hypothetical protein